LATPNQAWQYLVFNSFENRAQHEQIAPTLASPLLPEESIAPRDAPWTEALILKGILLSTLRMCTKAK
jgi:hypothetical protein